MRISRWQPVEDPSADDPTSCRSRPPVAMFGHWKAPTPDEAVIAVAAPRGIREPSGLVTRFDIKPRFIIAQFRYDEKPVRCCAGANSRPYPGRSLSGLKSCATATGASRSNSPSISYQASATVGGHCRPRCGPMLRQIPSDSSLRCAPQLNAIRVDLWESRLPLCRIEAGRLEAG